MSYIQLDELSPAGKTLPTLGLDSDDSGDENDHFTSGYAVSEDNLAIDETKTDSHPENELEPFDASRHITESEYETLLETIKVRAILFGSSGLALVLLVAELILRTLSKEPLSKSDTISIFISITFTIFVGLQVFYLIAKSFSMRKIVEWGSIASFHASVLSAIFLNYIANNDLRAMGLILGASAAELTFYVFLRFPNGKTVFRYESTV